MNTEVIEVGDTVLCDWCTQDWSDRPESGGFLFDSYAVCPECAVRKMPSIKSYGEEAHIKERCPIDLSFSDWIRKMRWASGSDKIIIRSS